MDQSLRRRLSPTKSQAARTHERVGSLTWQLIQGCVSAAQVQAHAAAWNLLVRQGGPALSCPGEPRDVRTEVAGHLGNSRTTFARRWHAHPMRPARRPFDRWVGVPQRRWTLS
jgi:hypothetical protein